MSSEKLEPSDSELPDRILFGCTPQETKYAFFSSFAKVIPLLDLFCHLWSSTNFTWSLLQMSYSCRFRAVLFDRLLLWHIVCFRICFSGSLCAVYFSMEERCTLSLKGNDLKRSPFWLIRSWCLARNPFQLSRLSYRPLSRPQASVTISTGHFWNRRSLKELCHLQFSDHLNIVSSFFPGHVLQPFAEGLLAFFFLLLLLGPSFRLHEPGSFSSYSGWYLTGSFNFQTFHLI